MSVQRLIESMDNARVDVLVFPTWSNPARLIGDYYSPDGAACTSKLCVLAASPSQVLMLRTNLLPRAAPTRTMCSVWRVHLEGDLRYRS